MDDKKDLESGFYDDKSIVIQHAEFHFLMDNYWLYNLDPSAYEFMDWSTEIPRLVRKHWWNPLFLIGSLIWLVPKTWWMLNVFASMDKSPGRLCSYKMRLFRKIKHRVDNLEIDFMLAKYKVQDYCARYRNR